MVDFVQQICDFPQIESRRDRVVDNIADPDPLVTEKYLT
jgi:hypothetical protein